MDRTTNNSFFDFDKFLEEIDSYITMLARHKVPRQIVHAETLDLDVSEIAQKTRIKLWLAAQKGPIQNPYAYVRKIVYHEAVNMVRANKNTQPIQVDDDGELRQDTLRYQPLGSDDPAYEVEQDEQLAEYVERAATAIEELPKRQRQAMLCSLRERIDDILPLLPACREHKLDIMEAHWPEEKDERHRLKALLSISRKKLRPELID